MTTFDFDLFVIGGGSGGVRASRVAASLGARVALAERGRLGGTCVNVGCVPKKLFVYGADVQRQVSDAARLGWSIPSATHDWPVLRDNVLAEVTRLNGAYARVVEGAGAEILRGHARLDGPERVIFTNERGDERVIRARHVLLATGAHPHRPSFPGAELAWVSDDVFTLERLPKSVVIVGAGYIGLEFATIFAGLGVEVTVLARHDHVLPHFDAAVSTFVAKQLEARGVKVATYEDVVRIERAGDRLETHSLRGTVFTSEKVLLATGRRPETRGLGLETMSIAMRGAAVAVDAHYRTTAPNVHAVGDLVGHLQLTPVALAEGQALARTLFGGGEPQTIDYRAIPTAVFTTPTVATVGLTEDEARTRGTPVAIFETEFRPMKATVTGSVTRAFMKLVVDRDTDELLGVHVVGDDAGEMVQGFAVVVAMRGKKRDLDRTIGIHPTAAEELVTMRTATRIDPSAPSG